MIASVMPVYARCLVAPVRGDGPYLYDAEDRRWLDFASGIAVNALGHGHPHLVEAVQAQAARLMHVSNLYASPQQQRVADRLARISFADTVFFTNSGAEALECAIKTARRYHYARGHGERFRILTFSAAFHGRTMATIAATDQAKLRDGFEPLPDWYGVLPFGDLAAVEAAMGPDVAAILVEPIQGEGGIHVAPPGFLAGLRAIADAHGLLLIFDEVQCGVARTGRLFAHEWDGVAPDIMALAKGLGGGFPVGACLATADAASGMTVGTHGSTYGGNPLAMAACDAVLDIVADPAFLARVEAIGAYLEAALRCLAARHPAFVRDVRGRGLMLGLKLAVESRPFVDHCRGFGILTVAAGGQVQRILPPLTIDEAHVDAFVAALDDALTLWPAASA